MQIADRNFLITGAGSGLGAACAERLAGLGARLTLVDLKRAPLLALSDKFPGRVVLAEADVRDEVSLRGAVADGLAAFGAIHGLIHCAGILLASRVVGKEGPHELELFRRIIDVNLVGTFNAIRMVAAELVKNPPSDEGERGVLVTTASVAAYEGQIGQAGYSASKAGVAGMTLPIARELAKFGVRVMSIAPGVFDTAMMADTPDEVRRSLGAQVPFPPRLGKPAEFAALVEHVIANPMLNGEVIRIDGAIRMQAK